ncbi:MAG TPA: isocitrate lyase/phosphoenolpyruvate mutase family protein [Chlamydiales bacterium]|nr:isocitrate lyase/phosphoenolpyruvate mutase family protein [Chlamydiales bacterium]
MSSKLNQFRELHRSGGLLILPNAWDAKSAALFQQHKFSAIGTSSAAVAGGLGYEDGERMEFNDYLFVVSRIMSVVQIPVTVDIEMGYGTSDEQILQNIVKLIELGVVGINIEDSVINESGRVLKDAETFAKTIRYVKTQLTARDMDIFINIRCDTFILNEANKNSETIDRPRVYENTGADGIFLPCISAEADIAEAVKATKLPVNVMCVPGLPGFAALRELGVRRVSMGPFLFNKIYGHIGELTDAINREQNFTPILS